MDTEPLKQRLAAEAIKYIEEGTILGVGTGSTVNAFIQELGKIKHLIDAAVASSEATKGLLKAQGIPVLDLNAAPKIPVYIDGADRYNQHKQLVKGGGGALVREKILAAASDHFLCLVDHTKLEPVFGEFPIPVEVIPMARSYVAREIIKLGGDPVLREDFVSDNGNLILDVYNWQLTDPLSMEIAIKAITGVVDNGLFAKRTANTLLIASPDGIEKR